MALGEMTKDDKNFKTASDSKALTVVLMQDTAHYPRLARQTILTAKRADESATVERNMRTCKWVCIILISYHATSKEMTRHFWTLLTTACWTSKHGCIRLTAAEIELGGLCSIHTWQLGSRWNYRGPCTSHMHENSSDYRHHTWLYNPWFDWFCPHV